MNEPRNPDIAKLINMDTAKIILKFISLNNKYIKTKLIKDINNPFNMQI